MTAIPNRNVTNHATIAKTITNLVLHHLAGRLALPLAEPELVGHEDGNTTRYMLRLRVEVASDRALKLIGLMQRLQGVVHACIADDGALGVIYQVVSP